MPSEKGSQGHPPTRASNVPHPDCSHQKAFHREGRNEVQAAYFPGIRKGSSDRANNNNNNEMTQESPPREEWRPWAIRSLRVGLESACCPPPLAPHRPLAQMAPLTSVLPAGTSTEAQGYSFLESTKWCQMATCARGSRRRGLCFRI